MDNILLELNPEFREPVSSKSLGFFGRENELNRLKKLFQNRTSATVLVSGHRGVGKSSLVHEALKRVRGDGKERVIAELTLPHVYQKSIGDDALRGQILRGLARALYFSVKDRKISDELKERANTLYKKSYLKELSEEESFSDLAKNEVTKKRINATETTFKPDVSLSIGLGSILSGGLAIWGVTTTAEIYKNYGLGWAITVGVTFVVAILGAGYAIKRSSSTEDTAIDAVQQENRITHTGNYDLTAETLEFELRGLVASLNEKGYPCVFIIDELDKLEAESAEGKPPIEQHAVFRIVASLKNFFTLGSGIFVFITGDDFYLKLNDSTKTGGYSLSHTLFTDRLFVGNLHYQAVEDLIEKLLSKRPSDEELYHKFRNYLCWESRGHVFDLLRIIDEYVVFDGGENPKIIAHDAGEVNGKWTEGNLPKDWKDAAGLQKYIGAIYDDSYRPSVREERYNHALWYSLLRVAEKLNGGEEIEVIQGKDDGSDSGGYDLPPAYWTEGLSEDDTTDISGAIERLLALLDRRGAVTATTEKRAVKNDVGEEERTFKKYTLFLDIKYPDSSIAKANVLTDYEEYFVNLVDSVRKVLDNSKAAGVEAEELASRLTKIEIIALKVKSSSLRSSTPKSEVSSAFEEADKLGEELALFSLESVIKTWAQEKGAQVTTSVDEPENRTGQPWGTSLSSEFPDLTEALRGTKLKYFLMGGTTDDQVLVLNNWDGEDTQPISEAYAKALTGDKARERRKRRLPVISITPSSEGETVKMPEEVVEVINTVDRASYSKSKSKHHKKTVKERRGVVGWNNFVLQDELVNLSDLKTLLEEVSYINIT